VGRYTTGVWTRAYLEQQLRLMLAGRAAEELVFGRDELSSLHQAKLMLAREVSERGGCGPGVFNTPVKLKGRYAAWHSVSAGCVVVYSGNRFPVGLDLDLAPSCPPSAKALAATQAKRPCPASLLSLLLTDQQPCAACRCCCRHRLCTRCCTRACRRTQTSRTCVAWAPPTWTLPWSPTGDGCGCSLQAA
jgi:hypothetical protein